MAPDQEIDRRQLLRSAGLCAGAFGLTGCEALSNLDTSAGAEGTGLQFSGLVKVLATYRSTPAQQTVAKQSAGRAYVQTALKPAYQQRRKDVESTGAARVKVAKKAYVAKAQAAKRASDPARIASVAAEEQQEIASIEAQVAAQTAAVDKSWQTLAISSAAGAYDASDIRIPTSSQPVAFASVQTESSQLLASASNYMAPTLAVSVPKTQLVSAEKSAADSVMFWDTKNRTLASSTVYVIDRKPSKGKVSKIGDVSAEYVGDGA